MGVKISALPGAASVLNAALIPLVEGGITQSANRAQLLEASGAEDLTLIGASGQTIELEAGGNQNFTVAGGGSINLVQTGGDSIAVVAGGGILVSVAAGNVLTISHANGALITIFAGGQIQITPGGAGVVVVGYVPAVPGQWLIVPGDLATAIDRLVAAVVARTIGGPV